MNIKHVALSTAIACGCCTGTFAKKRPEPIVICSNADEEAIEIIEQKLDANGFAGQYIFQSFGTSELGGKLIVEGKSIEANLVTMSSYMLETAQAKNNMFIPLDLGAKSIQSYPDYYLPILANMGALFVNTYALKDEKLPMPKTIKELASPAYKGSLSVPSIMGSSTGWLLIQAIINEYGEQEGLDIMAGIINNCGPHLESSGSGPIKKVRVGEVAVGFGLRHQAVRDAANGLPIQYVDPIEGNFSLTESVAVVDKNPAQNARALAMARVIMDQARPELLAFYPVAIYEGESVSKENQPLYSKAFKTSLTAKLLKQHQTFFNTAKSK